MSGAEKMLKNIYISDLSSVFIILLHLNARNELLFHIL